MKVINFNGPALIVRMYRAMDSECRKELLPALAKSSPFLFRLTLECEFIFSDILKLRPRQVEMCLRKIPEDDWLMVCKSGNPEVRKFLLKHMSRRQQEFFLSELPKQPLVSAKLVQRKKSWVAREIARLLREGIATPDAG